jgi:hypothetical protein
MNNAARQTISGVLAGGIAAVTAVMASLPEMDMGSITTTQWVIIGMGGFLAAAKDWKTLLAPPRV